MALTRVAASGDNSAAGTALSFATAWEGGFTPAAGDVAVLTGHVSATNLTMSVPAGWNALPGLTLPVDNGTTSRVYAWFKELTASEAAPTITNSGSMTGGWTLQVWRGAAAGTPIGQVAVTTATGTSIALGTLTGVAAGSAIGAHMHARVASGTIPSGFDPDADFTETIDHRTGRATGSANMEMAGAARMGVAAGNYSGDSFAVTNGISSSLMAVAYEVRAGVTDQTITATSIVDGGGFGSSNVAPGPVGLTATAIPSGQAFGAAVVAPGAVALTAAGLGSSETFGASSVAPGAVALTATGIASGGAFGASSVAPGDVTVAAAGVPPGGAFGAASVTPGPVGLTASGIPSGGAFGNPLVSAGALQLSATGIASGGAFGAATVALASPPQTLTATGIPPGGAFGVATVAPGAAGLAATGIPSAEALGNATLSLAAYPLTATGIPSGQAFGAATLAASSQLTADGIGSATDFGVASLVPGAISLTADGIASGEEFGLAALIEGSLLKNIFASGIPSAQSFGRAVVARMAVEEQEMAPCLWDVDTGCNDDWAGFTPEVQSRATRWATEMLWMLSGRRFGTCAVTVRPCQGCAEQSWQTYGVLYQDGIGGSWVPFLMDGQWSNCGCTGGTHSCHPDNEVYLPGPVAAISEVTIDGVVVPADAYRVDDGNWLVRHDGSTWPRTQNLNRRPGSQDTFVVTYLRGTPVPDGGKIAAGALAVEFARACAGASGCRLPREAQSIIRQGVELQLVSEDASDMLTGVAEADQWLRAVNPTKLRQRPTVASLDLTAPRVTTWG